MKKNLSKLTVALVIALLATALAASSVLANTTYSEILTSAIDGTPFVAVFSPETGIVEFTCMDGESRGYRDVGTLNAFQELVAFNAEVTSQPIEQRMDDMIISCVYPVERNQGVQISPFFDSGIVFVNVPHVPSNQNPIRGEIVICRDGRNFFTPPLSHRYLDLWTHWFTGGTITVIFINEIGDDSSITRNVGPNSYAYHRIGFRGEPYAAIISSPNRSIDNVPVRFLSSAF